MKKNTKMSIIIYVHENNDYTKNCIESLLNQTTEDFEILLVLDDKNLQNQIAYDYEKKYDFIKIINTKNSDILNQVKGEYILLLNSKDWLLLTGLKNMHNIAKKYNAQILINTSYTYDENNLKIETSTNDYPDNNTKINKNTDEIFIYQKNLFNMYKVDFLRKNKIKIPYNIKNCLILYFKAILLSKKVYYNNKSTIFKRSTNNNINQKNIAEYLTTKNINDLDIYQDFFNIFDKIIKIFTKNHKLYDKQQHYLWNYIIKEYKNIYSINHSNNKQMYEITHEKFKNYSKKYNTDIILNLNPENIHFYRNITNTETYKEYKLLTENTSIKKENDKLTMNLEKTNKKLDKLNKNRSNELSLLKYSNYKLKELEKEIKTKNKEIKKYNTNIDELNKKYTKKINHHKKITQETEKKYKKKDTEFQKLKKEKETLHKKINEMETSHSWKITKIFRKIGITKTLLILFLIIILTLVIIFLILILLALIMR